MRIPPPNIKESLHELRRLIQTLVEPAAETPAGESRVPQPRVTSDGADLPPPEELYRQTGRTADEVLVDLLQNHDGQLPQQEVVSHTGWAKSTVSEKLHQLEQEDVITRITLGREKLVCLPDYVPEAAEPPRPH